MFVKIWIKRTVEIRVGGRYRLGKKIGTGAFGEIFEGTDIFDNSSVAIKLEHNSVKYPQLLFEAKLLKLELILHLIIIFNYVQIAILSKYIISSKIMPSQRTSKSIIFINRINFFIIFFFHNESCTF